MTTILRSIVFLCTMFCCAIISSCETDLPSGESFSKNPQKPSTPSVTPSQPSENPSQNNETSEIDNTPYLTFKADETQTLSMTKAVPTIEYSVNGDQWQELGTKSVTFGGAYGDLRLRGKSSFGTSMVGRIESGPDAFLTYYDEEDNPSHDGFGSSIKFGTSSSVYCTGDIRTLIDYNNYGTADTRNAQFARLFYNCSTLKTAPSLPATELKKCCYTEMFSGCSSLSIAPVLPALSLTDGCYTRMFAYCQCLTGAPELPATSLADRCYTSMFCDCTSLTKGPELPAFSLTFSCYWLMFKGCYSLTKAPELPATSLASFCYDSMFKDCTSLTEAPILPATELTNCNFCYSSMFSGCSSLQIAPALPATKLSSYCYFSMFADCTSLKSAPELPATILENTCYGDMFSGCISLVNAPELPATTLAQTCYFGMFRNCSKINRISMYAVDISASECLTDWLAGVSPTGVFVKSTQASWDIRGSSGVPEGWTHEIYFDGYENGHTYVDLGLPSGTLWSTMGLDVNSPSDYGLYYAWGDTKGYADYDTSVFSWENYALCNGTYNSLTKYNTESRLGIIDNKTEIELEDDAANKKWGGNWQIPSLAQFLELMEECTWKWSSFEGKNGYIIKSKVNNAFIFLLANGRGHTSEGGPNEYGDYWTSTTGSMVGDPNSCSSYAYPYLFGKTRTRNPVWAYRCHGYEIRPIFIK